MATSGTFTGPRGGNSVGPYLTLAWNRVETDVVNNRSRLRLTLSLVFTSSVSFSGNRTGVLYGSSFTYSGGFSGTGTRVLRTTDVWVNHDSDGTKSVNLSASFNVAITWSGSHLASISVSGTANIDAIPRSSQVSTDLKYIHMGNFLTINTNRQSTSHTHTLKYKVGNSTGTIATGVSTTYAWEVPLDFAYEIPNTNQVTVTITCETYDGSKLLGSSIVYIYAQIKPEYIPKIYGEYINDSSTNVLDMYIQNISKIFAGFNATGIYGSSIVSRKITIGRTNGTDRHVINGSAGEMNSPISQAGQYEVIFEATDSRGRKAEATILFTSRAYTRPRISFFNGNRLTSVTTTVSTSFFLSWDSLSGENRASISITRKTGNTTTTLYTLNNSDLGSLNTTRQFTGQSDAQSHIYTLNITDSLGYSATAIITIGTSRVEFTIAKGSGVGIGKVHEKGALDVKGNSYLDGNVEVEGNVRATKNSTYIDLKPTSPSYAEITSNASLIDFMTAVRFYTGNVEVRNNLSVNNLSTFKNVNVTDTISISKEIMMSSTETGFGGVGSCANTGVANTPVCGVVISYKYKKTYTPSSISLENSTTKTANALIADIRRDGFWMYINSDGAINKYLYWRGIWTA